MKLKYLWMVMACGMFMACEEAGQIGQELAMTEQAVVEEISEEGSAAAEYGMNEMERDFSTLAGIYDAMGAVFTENPDNCSAVVEELRIFLADRKESFRHSMQRIFDNGMRLKAEHSEDLQDALDSTMQKKLWLMGMLATVLLVGGAASAYWGECTNCAYWELETPPGTYNYRINFDTFSEQGCSDEEAIVFAAASAGDAWNSEAGATSFQYTGATTNENWSSAFGCWWHNRQYSTIGAWDISSMGKMYSDCSVVPFIDCSEVFIQIDADRFSGDDKWRNMAHTITHEMGHAADLGHPTSDAFSTMNSQSHNNIPHLRQWESFGKASSSIRTHRSGSLSGPLPISHCGTRRISGGWHFRAWKWAKIRISTLLRLMMESIGPIIRPSDSRSVGLRSL